ncbi:AMP-binding protein [Variovorax sp. dw_954]|uniref:AMP-binding protein n=1 Tax=Variovorax sp. dw_954 TaxID=2720078 RepID=UPI001BD21B7B|nr:AMP-binding protein [Variovorax sp. dw_954]
MEQDQRIDRNLIQRVNVGDLLTRSAARGPAKDCVIDGERRFSYGEFEALANRVAHGLLSLGYGPGDALALMSANSAEFLATYFACAKVGVVCVPINLFWRNRELAYVLGHAKVRGAVVTTDLFEQFSTGLEPGLALGEVIVIGDIDKVRGQLADTYALHAYDALQRAQPAHVPPVFVEDRAPLSYLYTSGTTSAPKGVVGSQLAIYLESLGTAIDTRMSADERAVALMPMFHTAQINAICTPVIAVGGAICVMQGFDAQRLLDLVEKEKLTLLFGLPMMYRALLEAQRERPRDVRSLRLAVYAMAPMPDHELRAAIETFGCGFSLMFGQTEMSPVATFFRPEHQLSHPGAAGTPGTNVQVAIVDPDGIGLPQGEAGEIVYRSPQALSGYLHDEAATQQAFRHGWFHSGDVGYFDADGLLWFKDRFKDVIKSGGENIASIEVEKALYEAEPAIAEVVVIGLPHAHWSEAVTAVVVTRPGAQLDTQALDSRLRERLSPYKCPKAYIMVDALPKTATGKIQKSVLRERHAGHFREAEGR